MRSLLTALLLSAALTLSGCVSMPDAPGMKAKSFTLSDGSRLRYVEYVPPHLSAHRSAPLLIFLHGSGEAGTDIRSVLNVGPWQYARAHPDFPFIVLAPQLDEDGEWDPDRLNEWLEHIETVLPIDRRRIYLTGASRGGQGTWDFAMRYPRYFAAIAPLSGYSDVRDPCRLKGIAVWAFHGAHDNVVPIKYDLDTVSEARACGVYATLTIY
ncbi:MAG: carboxylesterase family protein, partial [Asticcacaulis sp.]